MKAVDTNTDQHCASLIDMAKRELGAFLSVVSDIYGSEEAGIAAENWLEELETRDNLPGFAEREWRLITIAAAARLAVRLCRKVSCNTARSSRGSAVRASLESTAAK